MNLYLWRGVEKYLEHQRGWFAKDLIWQVSKRTSSANQQLANIWHRRDPIIRRNLLSQIFKTTIATKKQILSLIDCAKLVLKYFGQFI